MFFIGVSTAKSSIMKVFPKWSEHLNLNAAIEGFDFEPHSPPELYREAVEFIKNDENSSGALVTTHKLDLYKACEDLFEGMGPYAKTLKELSSISKRPEQSKGKLRRKLELWGHAKDPVTSILSLDAIASDGYWKEHNADLLLLGAGGSSLALTLALIQRKKQGGDVPEQIFVCNRSEARLQEMKRIHQQTGTNIKFYYHHCPNPVGNDAVIARLRPFSVIANGTGLGKDRPGSPLTDRVIFPEKSIVWDFNYRGDLLFLDQARAQQKDRELQIEDGWLYFIYGWTQVIGEVFHLQMPTSGPDFEALSQLAETVRN